MNTTAKEVIIIKGIIIIPEGTLVLMKKDMQKNLERKETAMIVVDDKNVNKMTGTTSERSLLMTKGEDGTVLKKET